MEDYQPMELTDIVTNPNLKGNKVEVTGIARGVQDAVTFFGLNMPIGRRSYTGFLDKNDILILFQGNIDGCTPAMKELSMLRASSEKELPVTLQGKLTGNAPYNLKVSGVKFGDYKSLTYNDSFF